MAHSVAMAEVLLGCLPDARLVSWRRRGAGAAFSARVAPHYLQGMSMQDLATLLFELNWGVRPVIEEGPHCKVMEFCEEQIQRGRLVIISWRPARAAHRHSALAVGLEGAQSGRTFIPHTLLLLDPAGLGGWRKLPVVSRLRKKRSHRTSPWRPADCENDR